MAFRPRPKSNAEQTFDSDGFMQTSFTEPDTNTSQPKKQRFVRLRPGQSTINNTSSSSVSKGFHPLPHTLGNGTTNTTQHMNQHSTSSTTSSQMKDSHPQQTNIASRPRPPSHQTNNNNNNNKQTTFFPNSNAFQTMATKAAINSFGSSMGFGNIGDGLNDLNPFNQMPKWGPLSLGYYKYYFRVDNDYVLHKLMLLLLPFLKLKSVKQWQRKSIHQTQNTQMQSNNNVLTAPPPDLMAFNSPYQAPIYDVNAPDGYLPLMAVITYIVIMGFVVGNQTNDSESAFTPQVLITTASSAFFMLLFEVLLMKCAFYFIGSVTKQPPFWLDIVCYAGYKLWFVIINLILHLIIDNLIVYYMISILTGMIAAVFMIQTLRPYFRDLSEFASGPLMDIASSNEPKKTKLIFLVIVGLAQILFIQFMGRVTS